MQNDHRQSLSSAAKQAERGGGGEPGLDEMSDRTSQSKEDEQRRGADVAPPEERVLTPDPRDGRDDDRLCAVKALDGVV